MGNRLPTPGSDNGTWGNILNSFLGVSHKSDGTLANNTVGTNQIQSGAVTNTHLDGSTQIKLTTASTAVQNVNGKTGPNITLAAADISAVAASQLGTASGVATLDSNSTLTASQLPGSVVNGSSALLTAIESSGDSYAAGVGAVNAHGYHAKLVAMFKLTSTNRAIGGAVASWHHDGANPGDGGYANLLQGVGRSASVAPYIAQSNLVSIHYGFNDLYIGGPGSSSVISPFIEALRVMISRYRAAAVFEESDPSWAYTGSWAAASQTTKNSGAGIKYTVTPGDKAVWTVPSDVPAGTTVALGGYTDSSYSGSTTFLHNGAATGVSVADANVRPLVFGKSNGWVRRFVANPGDTIQQTCATVSSSACVVDYAQIEAPVPPIVLVHGVTKPYAGGTFNFPSVAARDAAIDSMNTAIQSLIAEFDQNVIFVDDNIAMGPKNPALFYSGDNLHPNDLGHSAIAAACVTALGTLTIDQAARIA